MNVFFSDEQEEPVDAVALRVFTEGVLRAEGLPPTTEVAVLLVSPEQITRYNETFMDRSGPTDVLAFPVEDLVPGAVPKPGPGDPPVALGDVFLCPAEVFRRAREEQFDEEDFLYLLLVHGILHLLGYDHDAEDSAQRMEDREDEILERLGRRPV